MRDNSELEIVKRLRIEASATEELHPADSEIAVMRQAATLIAAMHECLSECADDIEATVRHEYTAHGKIFDQRRYDRDMQVVVRARAALALGKQP